MTRADDASGDSILPQHKDPMSNRNPYAATSSEPRYEKPKKSRKGLWILLGLILAVVIIVGAVLGGVLGSRASKRNGDNSNGHDNSNGSGSNGGSSGGAHATNFPTGTKGADTGNTGLPSLAFLGTNRAVETQTGANGQVYLPIATDTYMNPGYATGVSSKSICLLAAGTDRARPTPRALLLLPTLPRLAPTVPGLPTTSRLPSRRFALTPVSLRPSTSGTLSRTA